MTLSSFIEHLAAYSHPHTYNPWRDYDERCDIGPEAPEIRRRQLEEYLESRINSASYLLIAEAAGYQGCRFTGIAITCERMLLDHHKQITSAMILGHQGRRTSNPQSPYLTNRPQREQGLNEPTDTYVWGAIVDNGLDPRQVLLWNIFPFHPHKDAPLSNRTPTDDELAIGLTYTKELLQLCRDDIAIGAIGKKSTCTLAAAGIEAHEMRHPANGGASQFRQQFSQWCQQFNHA